MALAASRDPKHVATSGFEGVHGRTYEALVKDLLETIWNGRVKAGSHAGGWRYLPGGRAADMSVTQWPVLAMMSAHEIFGIRTPEEVKQAFREGFLKRSQHQDGGFMYQPGRHRNIRLTGAGLIGLAFAEVEASDERVAQASAFIAKNWSKQNIGDTYAMYAVMKGAKLTGEQGIETFGEHDWRGEYAEYFYAKQDKTGGWPEDTYAKGALATAWPALILSKDVFATARPAEVKAWNWTLIAGIGGGFLAFLAVVLLTAKVLGSSAPARAPVSLADPAAV